MLRTTIEACEATGSTLVFCVIEIANIGGSRGLAQYGVRLLDSGGLLFASAELIDYPRWSEPVGGLVARAMAAVWPSLPPGGGTFTQGTFRSQTQLVPRGVEAPRLIAEWGAVVQDGRISVEASDEYGGQVCCEGGLDPSSDWRRIALAAQCMAAWSAADLPPWPKPFDVPIRTDDGTPYVRGADIPEPARTAFARNMYHSCRPVIAGEGPCYYAWDWRSFLSGLR